MTLLDKTFEIVIAINFQIYKFYYLYLLINKQIVKQLI